MLGGLGVLLTEESAIVAAIAAGAQSAANDGMSAMTSVLPIGMTVIGAGVVITLGLKFFKRITGKA